MWRNSSIEEHVAQRNWNNIVIDIDALSKTKHKEDKAPSCIIRGFVTQIKKNLAKDIEKFHFPVLENCNLVDSVLKRLRSINLLSTIFYVIEIVNLVFYIYFKS